MYADNKVGSNVNQTPPDMSSQLKKGVLELVTLSVLSQRDYYGFELVSAISRDIQISEGTIYPLLKRLKDNDLFTTYLQESSGGPSRKYYKITPKGIEVKAQLQEQWERFTAAVENILKGSERNDAQ